MRRSDVYTSRQAVEVSGSSLRGVELKWGAAELNPFEAEQKEQLQMGSERTLYTQAATVPQTMELWASGFNAWGQLDFEDQSSIGSPDSRSFKCVLRSQHFEIPRTCLSATLGKRQLVDRVSKISFHSQSS